jgi:hypothetical protein
MRHSAAGRNDMGAKLAGFLIAAFAIAGLPHTTSGQPLPRVRLILVNDGVVPVDLANRAQAEVTGSTN